MCHCRSVLWTHALVSLAAQSSWRQNSNAYVGFTQQDRGLRLVGSHPQDQLRHSSAPRSSFGTQTAVGSYSQGLSSSGSTQTVSQPAHSGYASVKLVQKSSAVKPRRASKSTLFNVKKGPEKQLSDPSTSIASGTLVSKYRKSQNDRTDLDEKGTWPVQQGTPRDSKYLSSSSASVQSPRKSYSFKQASHQSAAHSAPAAAAETPAYHGPRGYSPVKSASLFSVGAPSPQGEAVQMQTSASAPARLSLRRGAKRSSSRYKKRTRNNPSQTEAGKSYYSDRFPVNGGKAQEGRAASSLSSSSRSFQQSNKLTDHAGFQPRSIEMPTSQRPSYKRSYTSDVQVPSSSSALKESWDRRKPAQEVLPASRGGSAGTSTQRFAPTRTHRIPQRFGGFSIRRLKEPADQKEVSVRTPQQTYTAPSWQSASYRPQVQSVHPESQWKRIRPHLG